MCSSEGLDTGNTTVIKENPLIHLFLKPLPISDLICIFDHPPIYSWPGNGYF